MVTACILITSRFISFPEDPRRVAVRVPDHGERVPVRRRRLRADGLGGAAGLVQDRRGGRQVKINH